MCNLIAVAQALDERTQPRRRRGCVSIVVAAVPIIYWIKSMALVSFAITGFGSFA